MLRVSWLIELLAYHPRQRHHMLGMQLRKPSRVDLVVYLSITDFLNLGLRDKHTTLMSIAIKTMKSLSKKC